MSHPIYFPGIAPILSLGTQHHALVSYNAARLTNSFKILLMDVGLLVYLRGQLGDACIALFYSLTKLLAFLSAAARKLIALIQKGGKVALNAR